MYILAKDYRRYGRDNCRRMLLNCGYIFRGKKSTDGVNTIVKSSVSNTISHIEVNATIVWISSHSLRLAYISKHIVAGFKQNPEHSNNNKNRVCARDSVIRRKVKKQNTSSKQLISPCRTANKHRYSVYLDGHVTTPHKLLLFRSHNTLLQCRANMFWTVHHHPYHLSSSISN